MNILDPVAHTLRSNSKRIVSASKNRVALDASVSSGISHPIQPQFFLLWSEIAEGLGMGKQVATAYIRAHNPFQDLRLRNLIIERIRVYPSDTQSGINPSIKIACPNMISYGNIGAGESVTREFTFIGDPKMKQHYTVDIEYSLEGVDYTAFESRSRTQFKLEIEAE